MVLSLRAARAAEPSDSLLVFKVMPDLWHPQRNPDGYVSLGIAENTLMHDKLAEHIHANLSLPTESFTYGDGPSGSKRLKSAVAHFLTRKLAPVENLLASTHVTLTNGCSSAVEHLAWATSNPGDGILLGQPYYGTFIADLTARTGVHVVPVSFGDVVLSGDPDDTTVPGFISCLSVQTQHVIRPDLLHVVWGTSKDFGANGIRLGAIISQNLELHNALIAVGLYSHPSSITEHVVANILEDDAWVDQYIMENQKLLARNYDFARQWADQHGIEYASQATAGFFLWVNLGKYFAAQHGGDISWRNDDSIMDTLMRAKVFIASGKQFGSERPGWFRIVFSHRQTLLDEGLQRIVAALDVHGNTTTGKTELARRPLPV